MDLELEAASVKLVNTADVQNLRHSKQGHIELDLNKIVARARETRALTRRQTHIYGASGSNAAELNV